MSLLKNKHVLTAAALAPVLALIGYFAIDFTTGEKPHAAEKGRSYSLVEKPNCRYDSGRCGLKNGEFELDLLVDRMDGGRPVLKLSSAHPLAGVLVAVIENETDEQQPREMSQVDGEGLSWSLDLGEFDPGRDRLRLAASANESLYFGDVAMKFAQ